MAQRGHGAFQGAVDGDMNKWFDFNAASADGGAQSPVLPSGRTEVANTAPPQRVQAASYPSGSAPSPQPLVGFGNHPIPPQTSLPGAGRGFGSRSLLTASFPSTYPSPASIPLQSPSHVPLARQDATVRGQENARSTPSAATPSTYPSQPPTAVPSSIIQNMVRNTNNNHAHGQNSADDPRIAPAATSSSGKPSWDPAIATLADAAKWLSGEGILHLVIKVDRDDFEAVEATAQQWAKLLFDAILMKPESPPDTVAEKDQSKWWTKQDNALDKCRKKMRSTTDIKYACVLSMIVVSAAIKLHKEGLPINQLEVTSAIRVAQGNGTPLNKNPAIKTRTNDYAVDRFITCLTRLNQIIGLVKDDKRVALDVIEGGALTRDGLVRSPTACARVKREYFKNNATRDTVAKQAKTALSAGNASKATPGSNEEVDMDDDGGEPQDGADGDDESETE